MKLTKIKGLGLFAAGVIVSGAILLTWRARAAGIPDPAVLTYTGYLEDANGEPLTGEHSVAVRFWEAVEGGTPLCSGELGSVELQSGRFQVPLPAECTDTVKGNPIVFVDVAVDGASLGRTAVGAVPFAIEAGHATSADQATSADEATHATSADSADSADSAETAAALTSTAVLGVPVVKTLAASQVLTETLTLAADASYLLTVVMSGPGADVHQTYVVHTPQTALNVHAQPLLLDDFSNGQVEVMTQNGAVGWSYNPAAGWSLNIVFTNGAQPATAKYALVRIM